MIPTKNYETASRFVEVMQRKLVGSFFRTRFTLELFVPSYRLTTTGRRSFPVAAAIVWNTLPVHVQSSPSIATFRQRLKTFLFRQSFPDIII